MIEPNDFTKQALQKSIKTGAEVINFQLLDVSYDDREQFYYFVDLSYNDTTLYTRHYVYRSNKVDFIDIATDVNEQIDKFNTIISFGTTEELFDFISNCLECSSCSYFNYAFDGERDIYNLSDNCNFHSLIRAHFDYTVQFFNNCNLLAIYSKFFESLEKEVLNPAIDDYIKEYF